jgi:outer membrane PBP1 activator LpoA protein
VQMKSHREFGLRNPAWNRLVIATLLAVALAAPAARAQHATGDGTDLQALRSAVKSDKRAYVASMMSLTNAEAKRFWSIYEAHQRSRETSSRRRVIALEGLLFQDKAMTNLSAKNVITELTAVDEAEAKARRRLGNQLMRALPPIKAARYLQLEDKIQAVRDYDIASTVPLIH